MPAYNTGHWRDSVENQHYNRVRAAGWTWNNVKKVWEHPTGARALNQHVVYRYVTIEGYVLPPCANSRDECTEPMKHEAMRIAQEVLQEINTAQRQLVHRSVESLRIPDPSPYDQDEPAIPGGAGVAGSAGVAADAATPSPRVLRGHYNIRYSPDAPTLNYRITPALERGIAAVARAGAGRLHRPAARPQRPNTKVKHLVSDPQWEA